MWNTVCAACREHQLKGKKVIIFSLCVVIEYKSCVFFPGVDNKKLCFEIVLEHMERCFSRI